MVVLLIMAFAIGWLVGAKQEQKRILNPKTYTPEPEVVEKLQTLAGIKEHDSEVGLEILKTTKAGEKFVETIKQHYNIEANEIKSVQLTAEVVTPYTKNSKDTKKGVEILMSAPGSERFVELLKQNRADIESNGAASIQLTGESDSHYYYKQSKDTKKSDNNKK